MNSWTCIYPIYLDKSKSLENGRRIPFDFSIEKPSVIYIEKVCEYLGYEYQVELSKKHPKDPFSIGRMRILLKDKTKKQCLLEIAENYEKVKERVQNEQLEELDKKLRCVLNPWPDPPFLPKSQPNKMEQMQPAPTPQKPTPLPISSASAAIRSQKVKKTKKKK
jgi:signal recognition particle subunit SEC65